MGKLSNIEKYANESGIDSNKVGETILTAMSGGEIPNLGEDSILEILDIKLGIQPNDSKEEALKKITTTLNTLEKKEQVAEKEGDSELGQWLDHTRDEVEKVMQWIGQ